MEQMHDEHLPAKSGGYPLGKKDFWLIPCMILLGLAMVNMVIFGGFQLGFAVVALLLMGIGTLYLRLSGRKWGVYSGSLLILSGCIAAGFARSDDGFVKMVMLGFLFVGLGLALCLQAGHNRKAPGGFSTLLDPFRTVFGYGFGRLHYTVGGMVKAMQGSGTAGKKTGGILLGLLIAVPILTIVVALLISADAAFAGLMELLPEISFSEVLVTVIFGAGLALFGLSYLFSLRHQDAPSVGKMQRKGVNGLTVNTVLAALGLVYVVYLLSQLAYFVGGFSGILPEGYTMAEYARRGFFEMAGLCAINLTIMAVAMGLVAKNPKAPLATRLLCLFIGLVTLFFVVSASAKMAMYIQSYGLTRLRVLTEVIMVFLGCSTVFVCIWLFAPKMPYMKAVILTALLFGAVVIWCDVDTVVARYNVTAYQTGALETVDVPYLASLNSAAVPYLEKLTRSGDPAIAKRAETELKILAASADQWEDFRDWNWVDWVAENLLQQIETGGN